MATRIDVDMFTARIKAKRAGMGLRETANQIGNISASTLSRVENGKIPDTETFLRICDWLEESPDTFIISDQQSTGGATIEVIEAHLRADKNLDEESADAIAKMLRAAYNVNRRDKDA